jgi:hypothetical protein
MKPPLLLCLAASVALLIGCHRAHAVRASESSVRLCADAGAVRIPDAECGPRPILGERGHWVYLSAAEIAAAGAPAVGAPVKGGSAFPTLTVTYREAPGGGLPRGG